MVKRTMNESESTLMEWMVAQELPLPYILLGFQMHQVWQFKAHDKSWESTENEHTQGTLEV